MSKMSLLLDAASFFAQTAAPTGSAGGAAAGQAPQNFLQALAGSGALPLILGMGGIWFLMIAPQRKKQKEHERLVAALKSGDDVVTTGGIYGTITNVKEDRFVVRIADNTKIEIGKGFIASVHKPAGVEKM